MSDNNDNISDATILILRDIQARLGRLEERFDQMDRRFDQMDARFDNMISVFGGAYRDHDRRIAYVEGAVDRLDPTRRR